MTTKPYETPTSGSNSPPASGIVVFGGAIMAAGAYPLAVFAGTALHVAKNGVGDGSMPSIATSVSFIVVGVVLMALGFTISRHWLKNPDDPVSSFELFSVLICDPIPMIIGIYYLMRRRSRGARLLLTHALIVFVKCAVAALAWNPNIP